ncbi:MAG: 4Fe-4S dicluster domain-containing protein, partial [Vulcanococcus sp.]
QLGIAADGRAMADPHLPGQLRRLVADCAPFHPLELAYRFLLDQGISTLSLGAAQPSDLAWAAALAGPPAATERCGPSSPETPWLSPAHHAALERLAAAGRGRLGAERCGQCRACLPCPQAVPIPELLRLRNLAVGHGMQAFAEERYNLIGRAGHWWEALNASACARCGDCLPRCPHQLPIPDLLADTHRRLASAAAVAGRAGALQQPPALEQHRSPALAAPLGWCPGGRRPRGVISPRAAGAEQRPGAGGCPPADLGSAADGGSGAGSHRSGRRRWR